MALGPLLGNHALYRFVAVGDCPGMLLSLYIDTALTANVPTENLSFCTGGLLPGKRRDRTSWNRAKIYLSGNTTNHPLGRRWAIRRAKAKRKDEEKLSSVNRRTFFSEVELDFVPCFFTVRPFNELAVQQFLFVVRKA
jgi:hypothetical protein